MNNEARLAPKTNNKPISLKNLLDDERTKNRFNQVLGKKAPQFMASILNVASNNKLLSTAKPESVIKSALVAATLDLPIDQNLGFAYIVPYKDEAQFQLGSKGLRQLAIRSGQFLKLNVGALYDGQFKMYDPISDNLIYDLENKNSDNITHYVAYFKLINGFEKYFVMSVEELEEHARKYSQTYKKGFGVWKDNFKAMAEKTVLKLLLSKYAPLSIEMQMAQKVDQAVIKEITNEGDVKVDYIDNTPELEEAEIIEIKEEVSNEDITEEELADIF